MLGSGIGDTGQRIMVAGSGVRFSGLGLGEALNPKPGILSTA